MKRNRQPHPGTGISRAEIEAQLEARKRETLRGVRNKIRDVVAAGTVGAPRPRDFADRSEAETQNDLDLALLEMTSQAVARIDEALARVAERAYGYCLDCGDEIPACRLAVLPFAVRCTACAGREEAKASRPRATAHRASPWGRTDELSR